MDRDFLAGCLARGMSLQGIGALTNRHPSTVGYWVKKHGLVANGSAKYASRGGLTRHQLESLVEADLTLEQMTTAVDRSISTIRYWLARYGLRKSQVV